MTALARWARRSRLTRRLPLAGAAVAVAALTTLVVIGTPGAGTASAATNSYDQISGIGSTDSALTVPWTQGLLDSSNQPITNDPTDPASNADRTAFAGAAGSCVAGTGPLCFMYSDFQNLVVTVSQTQDITQQGITVSWTGGEQTIGSGANVQGNFLQLMECYGDSDAGPDPEDCEYGSAGLVFSTSNVNSLYVGDRVGLECAAGSTPTAADPPSASDGLPPPYGCDTLEPGDASPPHVAPGELAGQFSIPFVPVNDPSEPAYGATEESQYYNEYNTNEVQEAITNSDGDGQVQFEALTGTGAPGLGCGQLEADGQPRGCWLVIVPRGQYEPNGFKISGDTGAGAYLQSSPLSASNWAQRIQVHLDFATVPAFCPIGTNETETVGTQVVARAMQSWQLALNAQANCSRIYGYSAVPEATSTQELASASSGIGLAFTTIPIGSEAARDGTTRATLPPILYAPVAVSALGFGFNISQPSGYVSTPIKLTPELLARALTQTYLFDLPDYYPNPTSGAPDTGPAWAQGNPENISNDPAFIALNPEVSRVVGTQAPLLTEDHSALNQAVWEWIQTDTATDEWLDGTATGPVTVDPDYVPLTLGEANSNCGNVGACDSFPRAYSTCLDRGLSNGSPPKQEVKCSLDLLPYSTSYQTAAQSVLTGDNTATTIWDDFALAPDGTDGYWDKVGVEQPGNVFMWAIADTPDLAADGLIAAQLCNDDGSDCVSPTTASVTTALNSGTKDSAGLLEVNPASPGVGGYPLVEVTYAAVPTDQSAAALQNYAALIQYAAGPGQTTGVAPGDLPPGYLPLPTSLRNQANLVAEELLADAGTPTTAAPLPARSTSSTPAPISTSALSSPAAASPTPSSSEYGLKEPSAELVATTTPRQPLGAIRWTLLVVALVGAACATGGTVLRSARVPRWLHRLRP